MRKAFGILIMITKLSQNFKKAMIQAKMMKRKKILQVAALKEQMNRRLSMILYGIGLIK